MRAAPHRAPPPPAKHTLHFVNAGEPTLRPHAGAGLFFFSAGVGGFERPSEEVEEEEVGRVARGAAVSSCDCKYSEGDVRDGARAALGLLLYLLINYFHPLKVRCVKCGLICDSSIGQSLTYRPKKCIIVVQ